MNAITELQQHLHKEIPSYSWHCQSIHSDATAGSSGGIAIWASQFGHDVPGTPVYMSENLVDLWGADSAARVICHEIALHGPVAHHAGVDWDKLAEV